MTRTTISLDYPLVTRHRGDETKTTYWIPSHIMGAITEGTSRVLESMGELRSNVEVVKIRVESWDETDFQLSLQVELTFSDIGPQDKYKVTARPVLKLSFTEWFGSMVGVLLGDAMVAALFPLIRGTINDIKDEFDRRSQRIDGVLAQVKI